MRNKIKLVYGWGINDVDYSVTIHQKVNGRDKIQWYCPYYSDWKNIIQRCYCKAVTQRNPTYQGCTIAEEWKYLSNFIKWVDSQPNRDWQNCQPDKDLLVEGNKHYSPDTVVYIPANLNTFILNSKGSRNTHMLGVSKSVSITKPFKAGCCNPSVKGSNSFKHIGIFKTEMEAHKAWQAKKHEYALQLAELQDDPRVAKALRERYAPDRDWTNK